MYWCVNNMPTFLIEGEHDQATLHKLKRLYLDSTPAERAAMDEMSLLVYGWSVATLTLENDHNAI